MVQLYSNKGARDHTPACIPGGPAFCNFHLTPKSSRPSWSLLMSQSNKETDDRLPVTHVLRSRNVLRLECTTRSREPCLGKDHTGTYSQSCGGVSTLSASAYLSIPVHLPPCTRIHTCMHVCAYVSSCQALQILDREGEMGGTRVPSPLHDLGT